MTAAYPRHTSLPVACPRCGVPAGVLCLSAVSGGTVRPHAARRGAWNAKLAAAEAPGLDAKLEGAKASLAAYRRAWRPRSAAVAYDDDAADEFDAQQGVAEFCGRSPLAVLDDARALDAALAPGGLAVAR